MSARNGWENAPWAGEVRIEQLFIANSINAPDAADFLAEMEVGRLAAVNLVSKVRMQTWASDDLAYAPRRRFMILIDTNPRGVAARIEPEQFVPRSDRASCR